jgi:hypothetical protein
MLTLKYTEPKIQLFYEAILLLVWIFARSWFPLAAMLVLLERHLRIMAQSAERGALVRAEV